jgi:hypothetical protein
MSTPTTFYRGLTEETMTDGFIARLVVIEAKQRPDRHEAPPLLVTPPSLQKMVKDHHEALPMPPLAKANWNNPLMRPALYTVPWADEAAEARWIAIEDWQYQQIEDHGAHDGMIGRTAEHTIKIATVRALSRAPGNPAVCVEDIEWAYAIVQRSIDSLENGAREHMAGSQFEELCKAIMRARLQRPAGKCRKARWCARAGYPRPTTAWSKPPWIGLSFPAISGRFEIKGRGMRIKLKKEEEDAA